MTATDVSNPVLVGECFYIFRAFYFADQNAAQVINSALADLGHSDRHATPAHKTVILHKGNASGDEVLQPLVPVTFALNAVLATMDIDLRGL